MISIPNSSLYRIEKIALSKNITLFSFFAEADISSSKCAESHMALCSIICAGKSTSDENFISKMSSVINMNRNYRIDRIGYEHQTFEFIDVTDDNILFTEYSLKKITENDEEYDTLLSNIESSLYEMEANSPGEYLGKNQFVLIDESHIFTSIGALPLYGIITPLRRCEQYTLYSASLVILRRRNCETLYQNSAYYNKVMFYIVDIYDEFIIREYFINFRGDHISIRYYMDTTNPFGLIGTKIILYGGTAEPDPINRLYTIQKDSNLFQCGDLPKGSIRKNGEIITRI